MKASAMCDGLESVKQTTERDEMHLQYYRRSFSDALASLVMK